MNLARVVEEVEACTRCFGFVVRQEDASVVLRVSLVSGEGGVQSGEVARSTDQEVNQLLERKAVVVVVVEVPEGQGRVGGKGVGGECATARRRWQRHELVIVDGGPNPPRFYMNLMRISSSLELVIG